MDIHLYIPALITFGAAAVGCVVGLFSLLASFTDDTLSPGQQLGLAGGIALLYAAPVAALIAVGMQIAHWV